MIFDTTINLVRPMRRLTTLLLALTAACTTGTEPASRLEIDVAVSRTQVLPGDTLTIVVTAFNPTDRPIRIPQAPCMPLMYRVYAPDGTRLAPPASLFCSVVDSEMVVGPRESRSVTHGFAALVGYHSTAEGADAPLPPGEYTVIGGIADEPDLRSPSPPVILEVVAP